MDHESVTVIVIDNESWQKLITNEDTATTLIAVASEDPANWSEMVACWPRYATRVVREFASSLAIKLVDRVAALEAVSTADSWVVLDLIQKRFLSGSGFQLIERDACFAMHTDENGDQHDPLSVHLAPWWELHEQTDPEAIEQSRSTPINLPFVDREFLFGKVLIEYFANRVLEAASTETGRAAILNGVPNRADNLYKLKIEIHRDWLMTPRDEIDGRIPREMLHGGMDWIEKLAWSQRLRFDHGGLPIVALPKELTGYANGPMGREEIALYFDLCRELLGASWFWCKHKMAGMESVEFRAFDRFEDMSNPVPHAASNVSDADFPELVDFLHNAKTYWLHEPFEGASPPAFIIECSRRRVPRGAGVEIAGMSERQSEQHVIDCDCPVCLMMADGSMGISFAGIDGHHLELDEEFAFSLHETREAWEAEQREYAEFSAKMEADRAERERKIAAGEIDPDEFDSAWSSGPTQDSFPGGPHGNLQLAFLLAEVVSEIGRGASETDSNDNQQQTSARDLIEQLNANFSEFRNCDADQLQTTAASLSETLELIAAQHPDLTPRIADFQSRIQGRLREPVTDENDWGDIPF